MMDYEELLNESDNAGLIVKEKPLRANAGRIKGNRIAIQGNLTSIEKSCVLAEELGHHHTSTGDILDQSRTENRKQELHARFWAYNKKIGLNGIISACKAGCRNRYETAEYLCVTEEFLQDCIDCYRNKYGIYVIIDNFVIYFIPQLTVLELL